MFQMRKLLILFAALFVLVAGCDDQSSEQAMVGNADVPDEVVTDFVTEETDSGLVSWTLNAPKANKYNSRKVFVMDKPKIEFFDEFGNLQTTLTSEFGEYYQESREMLAFGNVVVVSVVGDVLETDSLRYVTAVDKIMSDNFVKITRGDEVVITGIGLECDHTLNSVVIKEDFKATIINKDDSDNEQKSELNG
jgi:LPS export ABC transporter protein LptC